MMLRLLPGVLMGAVLWVGFWFLARALVRLLG